MKFWNSLKYKYKSEIFFGIQGDNFDFYKSLQHLIIPEMKF